jgi:hypothetical protein
MTLAVIYIVRLHNSCDEEQKGRKSVASAECHECVPRSGFEGSTVLPPGYMVIPKIKTSCKMFSPLSE